MEPKFQSSFIPKGPIATSGTVFASGRMRKGGLFGSLSVIVFIFSVAVSIGVFGYAQFLKARISRMGNDLAEARQTLAPEVIRELSRLDSRLVSTEEILNQHTILSPLFDFLQSATLRSVRFTDFRYDTEKEGLALTMKGQARGYAALSLQSDVFSESPYFKEPIFSNLDLDDRGNVVFTFAALVDPAIVSYRGQVERAVVPSNQPVEPAQSGTTTPAAVDSVTSTSTGTSTASQR